MAAISVDDGTDRLAWAAVCVGGDRGLPLVPLVRATADGSGYLTVPFPVPVVCDAPAVRDELVLDLAFEDRLYAYYAAALLHPCAPAPRWPSTCRISRIPVRLRRYPDR